MIRTILHLISGPRNISTALMYSFAQRPDTNVVDEPFYSFYLKTSGAEHPGKELVLRSQPQREKEVFDQFRRYDDKPVLFVKNMAHHLETMTESFPLGTIEIFLIRDPSQIIASYSKVIDRPVMRDIGIKFQFEYFRKKVADGNIPVVVDSNILLRQPSAVLELLCQRVGIPFYADMLHWKEGPKSYDGVWAPYWYKNVHLSTCFSPHTTDSRQVPEYLVDLYEEARGYYEDLLAYAIHP